MTSAVVAVVAVLLVFGLPVAFWLALIGVYGVVLAARARLRETPS